MLITLKCDFRDLYTSLEHVCIARISSLSFLQAEPTTKLKLMCQDSLERMSNMPKRSSYHYRIIVGT